jgi:flavin-dependent dehydrogenase
MDGTTAGPAGVSAAIAAGREGARTVLVERYGMAGGMWTAGLVNPFFEATRNGWQDAVDEETARRLGRRGYGQ